jgi:hypothetical protein
MTAPAGETVTDEAVADEAGADGHPDETAALQTPGRATR